MQRVFICDAVRTPRGKGTTGGALSDVLPLELVRQLTDALRYRHDADPLGSVQHLALGAVTQAGTQGGHLALAARTFCGLPELATTVTLNNFCVSGLSAVFEAARRIALGEIQLALAGGVESMSTAPFMSDQATHQVDARYQDSVQFAPPGFAADLMATEHQVSAAELDRVTLQSHRRAAAAWDEGRNGAWVIPVRNAQGTLLLERDETIRPQMGAEQLAELAPVFLKAGRSHYDALLQKARGREHGISHFHSVAHCPPMADGAALILLASAAAAKRMGLKRMAELQFFCESGTNHVAQLEGGFAAMEAVLAKSGCSLDDLDHIEFMESFAVVAALYERRFPGLRDRSNPDGGHLALGHPMGASGAMLLGAVINGMNHRNQGLGMVVATGGGGVGAAAIVSRVAP